MNPSTVPTLDLIKDFHPHEDTIQDMYVDELWGVFSERALHDFTKRWAQIYEVEFANKSTSVGLGEYDAMEALDCIAKNRRTLCEHAKKQEDCAGATIVLPELLYRAFEFRAARIAPFNMCVKRLIEAAPKTH